MKGIEMLELNVELYRRMRLIRTAEEAIQLYYGQDKMKTPMHMSMGEEAIVAGVCQALTDDDQVVGSYRSHGLYLAKTMELGDFFAEMYGKQSGCAMGKAGSMHLCSPEHGMMGSCAIVAGYIPVAVGLAFANKYKRNNKMTAVFFGDGAIDEGAFWESLNAACLYKLPLMFVCEDNGLAVHTPPGARHGYKSIARIAEQFDCAVYENGGTNAEEIYMLTNEAIRQNRENSRPAFLHLHYYRYLEHVGIQSDFDAGYRSIEEFKEWERRDPVLKQRDKLLEVGVTAERIKQLEDNIQKMVERGIEHAEMAEFCDVQEAYRGVYACEC
jgi:pyruvate dehydrogenase E1 component alpha subunit